MTPAAAFLDQAASCAALGSPFTARLLAGLADRIPTDTAIGTRIHGWPGDISSRGASVPLRLAGGLHALVLSGTDPALAAAYGDPDAPLIDTALAAMTAHAPFLQTWLDSPPQTNEVRRSAALIAAAQWICARAPLPVVISELGASAGLNLLWDRYALAARGTTFGPPDPVLTLTPDWTGPLPPHAPVTIAARAGVDLNPLDPVTDRLRLMAYVWADQTDRLTRTDAAAAEAARLRPRVDRGDAIDWLATRLADPRPGHLHLVQNTVAWQYFPSATQARGRALMAAAGARATPDTPLAHVEMEADSQPGGAALTATLWPGGEKTALARVDFHGRWLRWHAPVTRPLQTG